MKNFRLNRWITVSSRNKPSYIQIYLGAATPAESPV